MFKKENFLSVSVKFMQGLALYHEEMIKDKIVKKKPARIKRVINLIFYIVAMSIITSDFFVFLIQEWFGWLKFKKHTYKKKNHISYDSKGYYVMAKNKKGDVIKYYGLPNIPILALIVTYVQRKEEKRLVKLKKERKQLKRFKEQFAKLAFFFTAVHNDSQKIMKIIETK